MIEQRSEAWFAERLGCVTASRVAEIMAQTKSGPSASRDNYLADLVLERLNGVRQEGYVSDAMKYGTDMESQARELYAFMVDQDVIETGFVRHPSIPCAGASPDGLCGLTGLVEIKVPQPAGHLRTIRSKRVPRKYVYQMMFQLACTGRQWCDYVSYNPTFPPHRQLYVERVRRDDAMIAELEAAVRVFLSEVDATVAEMMAA